MELDSYVVAILVLFSFCEIASAETVRSRPGHYPYIWCEVSNVILSTQRQHFMVSKEALEKIHSQCAYIPEIWPFDQKTERKNVKCDKEFEEGHVFTIYYNNGVSNYFHLHYDMMLPLYQTLHHDIDESDESPRYFALLPTVETSRLKAMDWKTKAFDDSSKYWMQLVKLLLTDKSELIPLDNTISNITSAICFNKLYFGTAKYNIDNANLLAGFAHFVKKNLFVLERPVTPDNVRVSLISRSNRRKILNENELLDALRPTIDVDLIRFEGLKVREQVSLVQKYGVIIGMNGAGLMNAMFRPAHSVAIQLVHYKGHVNHEEFGKLLSSTGLYLVWHNTHEKNHFQNKHDNYNNNADTIVDVKEFKDLVQQAISIAKDSILGVKDEL